MHLFFVPHSYRKLDTWQDGEIVLPQKLQIFIRFTSICDRP
jgi:hypothetical protein